MYDDREQLARNTRCEGDKLSVKVAYSSSVSLLARETTNTEDHMRLRHFVSTLTVAIFAVAGLASQAGAFDEPIPTKVGLVKFDGDPPAGILYKLVSKAPNPPLFTLPTSSPAVTGGSLTVTMDTGTLSCTLAPGLFAGTVGWKELGSPTGSKGYKYINKLASASDPCKIVILKEKVINVLAKATGTLPAPLASGNPDVDTVLTLGTDDYCALWGEGTHFKEKQERLINAKNQPPPGACPGGQTTTTTITTVTTTTTTTLPPPVCGDHEVNQPTEECDGTDGGACPFLCQVDCTCPKCGDGECEGFEPISCPQDCQVIIICGDGICTLPEEDPSSCPEDCGSCGDGICTPPEDFVSCWEDCPICFPCGF